MKPRGRPKAQPRGRKDKEVKEAFLTGSLIEPALRGVLNFKYEFENI